MNEEENPAYIKINLKFASNVKFTFLWYSTRVYSPSYFLGIYNNCNENKHLNRRVIM